MNCYVRSAVLLCVLTVATRPVALADTEDKSEELAMDVETRAPLATTGQQQNDSSAEVALGPPDSHEAMNNREINPKMREKRSYEFLMGLVNNNSKYEVTKIDLSTKPLQQQTSQDKSLNTSASELLLELMVKIAAHPDHWDRVHNLLKKIDNDLLASKKLVDELQVAQIHIAPKVTSEPAPISVEKKEEPTKNKSEDQSRKNQWPTFGDDPPSDKPNTIPTDSHRWKAHQHKSLYPKTFAYQRVTGRPLYLNKNPKAYIAVSVIAPKPLNTRSNDEDLVLEKELRQLKPWTHNQNLKNMASIRSRWVIQTDENKKDTVAP